MALICMCIFDFQEDIYSIKQGDNTIRQFFTTLKTLLQELNCFPFRKCNYQIKCSFLFLPTLKNYRDNDCYPISQRDK